ncbi:MAG: Protein TolB [Pseudomonadota bacterium]|jgi:TolB protein
MSHRSFFFLFLRWFSLVGALVWGLPAQAQFRVEVTGVGMTRIPVVLVPLRGQAAAPQKISDIVQADLERSGQFKGLDAAGTQLDELASPDANAWRQRGADALVAGSMTRLADGRYDIRARLWDIVTGQEKSAFKDIVTAGDLRLSAHRMADWVFQQLTGTPGVFSTRIAYVTKSAGRYNLWVADADGEGARTALTSPEPIISPSWSPSGEQLAYVSFELHKPVIFVHELSTGKRRVVANFKGSNSAPGWSPDGRALVATLSRSGGSQIYQIALQGGEPRRLQQSYGIDTEPVYTPDGSQIYFVSDRGGSPQIYRMPASGGAAERVTFSGNYNISPSISPDGRWMAYVSRNAGQFKVHVMDLATGLVSPISDTTADERPSFAPNSKMLIYATVVQGRESLVTSTLDGRIKARLAGQNGDIREPGWGPMRK